MSYLTPLRAAVAAAGFVLAMPAGASLTLEEAERLALADDPAVAVHRARAEALAERAVAEGELPDPRLRLGLVNFPADTFSRPQEPMTQIQVGVQQAFPSGDTLTYRQRSTELLADAGRARTDAQQAAVRREVRLTWLELYYWAAAARVVDETKPLFGQLINVTRSLYAAGRDNQQDILRAELELSLLEDRETRIETRRDSLRATLAQWIGEAAAQRPLPDALASLARPPDLPRLRERVTDHPVLNAEHAVVRSRLAEVDIAREQYAPSWMLDIGYGARGGRNVDGSERADFVSAMVTIDLPLFTDKRQDRRLAASQRRVAEARASRDDRYRDMVRRLESAYAEWRRLGERLERYRKKTIDQARRNAEASLRAYRSDATPFTTVMRARMAELDTRLERLRVEVDRAKVQARLLYIAAGGDS